MVKEQKQNPYNSRCAFKPNGYFFVIAYDFVWLCHLSLNWFLQCIPIPTIWYKGLSTAPSAKCPPNQCSTKHRDNVSFKVCLDLHCPSLRSGTWAVCHTLCYLRCLRSDSFPCPVPALHSASPHLLQEFAWGLCHNLHSAH